MATGIWIVAGDLLARSGDASAITFVLLVVVASIGVVVASTQGLRGADAARLARERHPTLAEAVSPPP